MSQTATQTQATYTNWNDAALHLVKNGWICAAQYEAMLSGAKGEEKEFFRAKFLELANRIDTMPVTYEQEGKGNAAIVSLHYFLNGWDWYITEKDIDGGVMQAYGLVSGLEVESGYICILELIQSGVEIDLHFTPTTLGEVKKRHN